MNYLQTLESELAQAGIPPRRRARIVTEFADHLQENPEAELGAPRLLARQFADVLGTRLARSTAYWSFGVMAVAAFVLVVMFFEGGRTWGGWVGYGSHPYSGYIPSWWVPLMVVWFISAQLALAAGALALLRAWRLRHEAVITAADAAILRRPLSAADRWHSLFAVLPAPWWGYVAIIGGPLLAVAMLSMLRMVLAAARMTPQQEGAAGDLTLDLGVQKAPLTPQRMALAMSTAIVMVMLVIGIGSNDPLAGLARGFVDAALFMAGFAVLGTYLGLRTTARRSQVAQ
jgi:hypothetical protein